MREHTGNQPFRCTICGTVCDCASEYQTHMSKHTDEQFSCIICEKEFTTSACLQEHTRTHTDKCKFRPV